MVWGVWLGPSLGSIDFSVSPFLSDKMSVSFIKLPFLLGVDEKIKWGHGTLKKSTAKEGVPN